MSFILGFSFRGILSEKKQVQKHSHPLYMQGTGTMTQRGRDLLPSEQLLPEALPMGHREGKGSLWKFDVSNQHSCITDQVV